MILKNRERFSLRLAKKYYKKITVFLGSIVILVFFLAATFISLNVQWFDRVFSWSENFLISRTLGYSSSSVQSVNDMALFLSGAVDGILNDDERPSINFLVKYQDVITLSSTLNKDIERDSVKKYVPATLEYVSGSKKVVVKGKIRSKGDRTIHRYDLASMSYRVNLKGDDRLFSLEEFSVQRPIIRNYSWEYLIESLFRREDILTLKNEVVDFYFNGDYRGIYSIEEVPSKITLESNSRKNAPIYGLEESFGFSVAGMLDLYDAQSWLGTDIESFSSSMLYREFDSVLKGVPFSSASWDMGRWAKFFALNDLFGSYHGTVPKSVKFSFNSTLGKFEPLRFDSHKGSDVYSDFILLDFLTRGNDVDCHWICVHKSFYLGFLKNREFLTFYEKYLAYYSSADFVSSASAVYEKKYRAIDNEFYANLARSDVVSTSGIGLYLFKFSEIERRALLISQRLALLGIRRKADGDVTSSDLGSPDALLIPSDPTIKVMHLSDFHLVGNLWVVDKPTIAYFSKSTLLQGNSKSDPLIIDGPLMFIQEGGDILIQNVQFIGSTATSLKNRGISGAFNIIDSVAKISNVSFSDISGEDALNVVNSEIVGNHISFESVESDALDLDFSSGSVDSIVCVNVGNDCLDFSNSAFTLGSVTASFVGDKAVSSGESSQVSIGELRVTESRLGMVSKDGSLLSVGKGTFVNVERVMAAFVKKASYGQPSIKLLSTGSISGAGAALFDPEADYTVDDEISIELLDSKQIYRMIYE